MNYLNEFEEDYCEDATPLDFADKLLIMGALILITVGASLCAFCIIHYLPPVLKSVFK